MRRIAEILGSAWVLVAVIVTFGSLAMVFGVAMAGAVLGWSIDSYLGLVSWGLTLALIGYISSMIEPGLCWFQGRSNAFERFMWEDKG